MSRLLRDTLDEWAGEARVPHDLADRALRRRARWKPVGAAVLVMGLVAAVAVVVAGQRDLQGTVRPASGITLPSRPSPAPTDVRADTKNNPPAKFIAAGRLAVSAYYTSSRERISADLYRERRTWSLYDPRTGGYERASWAWVDVAPGLQVAAVIEGDAIGRRLGVIDMNTRKVLKWFDLEHPAGAVSWSPDGKKILATTYSSDPDVRRSDQHTPSPRTGYYVIDVEAGTAEHHELAPLGPPEDNGTIFNRWPRQDLGWSLDGSMIWAPVSLTPFRLFYSLDGRQRDFPEEERYNKEVPPEDLPYGAVSPDGRLVFRLRESMPTKILDRTTGEIVGSQESVGRLYAWADDDDVIAEGCGRTCENPALVLVSVDGKRRTRLSADGKAGAWSWVLTPR